MSDDALLRQAHERAEHLREGWWYEADGNLIAALAAEVEQLREALADKCDIAMSALHDITEMEWGERKETPFQFEQRIHAVAHEAWTALRRTAPGAAE